MKTAKRKSTAKKTSKSSPDKKVKSTAKQNLETAKSVKRMTFPTVRELG